MAFKGLGIIEGPKISFVDHMLPLCHLLEMPLFCDHPDVRLACEIYYPQVQLSQDVDSFSTFFYVEPTRLGTGRFFLNQKFIDNAKGIVAFHGNSNKNRNAFWIERFADEETVLVYGDFFLQFMKEKNVLSRVKKTVRTGNFRYRYYKDNKDFFDRVAQPFVFSDKKRKTILYAPTWHYSDKKSTDYSNFFDVYEKVLDPIPDDFQIIVKLHPFSYRLYPEEIETIKKKYEGKDNILFLDEIPLVYPILQTADIYLGDYSSISYDFLSFNRPLFFLRDQTENFGRVVKPDEWEQMYSIFDEKDTRGDERKKHYERAFDQELTMIELKNRILEAL